VENCVEIASTTKTTGPYICHLAINGKVFIEKLFANLDRV
jgi:hypothetical protein